MTPVPGSDLEAGLAAPALPSASGRGRLGVWAQASVRWIVEHAAPEGAHHLRDLARVRRAVAPSDDD